MNKAESWLQKTLEYRFADDALLTRALTHRSAAGTNNERLEFLGDAVLDFVISEAVFELRPDAVRGRPEQACVRPSSKMRRLPSLRADLGSVSTLFSAAESANPAVTAASRFSRTRSKQSSEPYISTVASMQHARSSSGSSNSACSRCLTQRTCVTRRRVFRSGCRHAEWRFPTTSSSSVTGKATRTAFRCNLQR